MKIGVAIPCYYGHINNLFILLDSIQKQTILPDKVVVSCSSTPFFENKNIYSFPLEIMVTEERKTAAQNRNICVSKLLDMDYISFIDADDIMHIQRIELLLEVFKRNNVDIILHNYYNSEIHNIRQAMNRLIDILYYDEHLENKEVLFSIKHDYQIY
jgi:hypothetical protein